MLNRVINDKNVLVNMGMYAKFEILCIRQL